MLDPLLPRLKKEIEARLAELRPLVAEVEQLEAAKTALLNGGGVGSPAVARVRRVTTVGTAVAAAPARPRRVARPSRGGGDDAGRAPRGANRDAILQLVEERPGVSVAEIASVTKIAKPTVATTVSKLKRDGVLADEAGGVKLASRAPVTLAGAAPSSVAADSASDAEWDAADPKAKADTAA